MKNNPFKTNVENIMEGYYFDDELKVLCYITTEDLEHIGTSIVSYNRFSKSEENISNKGIASLMMQNQGPENWKESKYSNCSDLNFIKYAKEAASVSEDFKWISKKSETRNHFVNYLLETENYEFLNLFNKVIKKLKICQA